MRLVGRLIRRIELAAQAGDAVRLFQRAGKLADCRTPPEDPGKRLQDVKQLRAHWTQRCQPVQH